MDNRTKEMMDSFNTLMQFVDNLRPLSEMFPESDNDIMLLEPYIAYEIKKTLKDIIHIEKL
jgi:hypothetical protein